MRVPKYRKHSSRNLAFVEIKGQRIYLGEHGSHASREAYKRLIAEHFGRPLTRITPSSALTVGEMVAAFLDYARTHYGTDNRGSLGNMTRAVAPFGIHFAVDRAAELGPLKLKEWRQGLVDRGGSRKYVNSQISKIRLAFKWAVSEELIPVAVYQALTTVADLRAGRTEARETDPKQPVDWKHVEPVLSHLSESIQTMILVQWHTGVRPGSVCRATPAQFERTETGELIWRPRHKNEFRGQSLIVYIGPKCAALLASRLNRPPEDPMFPPREQRNCKRYTQTYTAQSYRNAIHRGIKRLNLVIEQDKEMTEEQKKAAYVPLWSPHQLRHAKARAVREKYGIEAAQAVLGHESIDATEIYTAKRLELAKRVAEEVG